MNALELSMADVTLNQPQNLSMTGWEDNTLKRTYGTTLVPGSNQLETTTSKFYVTLYHMCDHMCTFIRRKTMFKQVLKGDLNLA